MSQNQSYFWQTTRHNVYLKRSAKWHMMIALIAVLTFSTICAAEFDKPKVNDDMDAITGVQTHIGEDPMLDKDSEIGATQMKPTDEQKDVKAKGDFLDAFTASISVILLTELGDKTFFIAAIMAMRHARLIVFGGAIAALALMTVLSCVFGMAANFIPKVYTYYISTALFLIFGLKMLYDGYKMKPTDAQEEMEEVQTDLRKREDELMRRATRGGKYDDADTKRKNSNSEKEDPSEQTLIHGSVRNVNANVDTSNTSNMQHRQRKQRSNNNNTTSTTTTKRNNSCDKTGCDSDFHAEHESEVFKDSGRIMEQIRMSTFHGSPAISASIASNQTEQTICDNPRNNITSNVDANASCNLSSLDTDVTVGEVAPLADHEGMNSLNVSCASSLAGDINAAGTGNGALTPRLDRDVNAALVQDPETGRRRNVQRRTATYFTMRVFAQAFTMTFLAEWGDRSQLTTIILAASKDILGVIVGGVLGHCICTGLAVIGGRLVASKISVRTVTIVGGIVFIGFAVYALLMRPDDL